MILVAIGESHGNLPFVSGALRRAASLRDRVGCDVVAVSVGDFGFWPGLDGERFVQTINERAKDHDLALWVIDGNHDYSGIGSNQSSGYRAWTDPAPRVDRPGLAHIARGTTASVGDVRIGFFGGAASPDQGSRVPGVSWWPDEVINESEVEAVVARNERVDLAITHGSPCRPHRDGPRRRRLVGRPDPSHPTPRSNRRPASVVGSAESNGQGSQPGHGTPKYDNEAAKHQRVAPEQLWSTP